MYRSAGDWKRNGNVNAVEVTLPGGFAGEERWERDASLRPLTGRDEAFLVEADAALSPAERSTALLTRCVIRLGAAERPTPGLVRSLTVGDREALLLHLRRLTFGEHLSCVLTCPSAACGQKMDLDLRVSDLLVPPSPHETVRHETVIEAGGERYRVCLRLPTGDDQEAVVPLALSHPAAAASAVLRRCLERIDVLDAGGVCESGGEVLSPEVVGALAQRISELDPQAETLLHLTCPACEAAFTSVFDAGDYLWREVAAGLGSLHREVHLLAFHYHWSEAAILHLTAKKRRLYLGLLAEALTEGSAA
jgi:hypothetical protein